MKPYHTYFHPDNIIKLLCKYRLKYTKSKHKLHLLADISHSPKIIKDFKEKGNMPVELSSMLPPRRSWYKPRLNERKRFADSQKLQLFSLRKTILTVHMKAKEDGYVPPSWYNELDLFIKKIQERVNFPDTQKLKPPITKAVKKEKVRTSYECRPISLYDLEDRIIISLTAKYFTELFDDCFHSCSYAFRAVKNHDETRIVKTHHDAINAILEFHSKHKSENIFVAECDIQKFFDCVNHDFVNDALTKCSHEFNIDLNENAVAIFNQYLDSYSFSKDVYPLNSGNYFEERNLKGCHFKWVASALKNQFYASDEYDENLYNVRIGVPQGGALSCFISNLLLHSVDTAVFNSSDPNLLYIRYCDDMVILHTEQEECEKALERYQVAIKSLKLLVHEPQKIETYSKKFWQEKSKHTYRWHSKSITKSNVPWLAFVGYQIKFDGTIRVRKKSLIKELNKQKEECTQILKALNHYQEGNEINSTSKKSKRQQLYALENRLISMSVGRVKLYEKNKHQALCWTNGFKALFKNKTSSTQLKILDRNRTQNLYRIKKELKKLIKPTENPDVLNEKKHFGSPYSYHAFIMKNDNTN